MTQDSSHTPFQEPNIKLMSLRGDRCFSGYWKALADCRSGISDIFLVGNASTKVDSALGELTETGQLSLLKLGASAFSREKLEAMPWYGYPGEIVFCSQDESILGFLEEFYEVETSAMETWTDEFVNRLQAVREREGKFCTLWAFTWDADAAVVLK